MPPKGKRHGCRSVSSDILSNLPENIMDAILMHLPIRDTVRTSILSKKWRYNWCRLPELTLDQTLWGTTNNLISSRFTDIMYHLLTLHVGPITKFILSSASLGNCPKIDNLICFLSRNGIQHLVLQFPKHEPYKLPSAFFTCLQTKHLKLQNCFFHPPPTFKGFNQLVSLELCEVTISSEVLGRLVSRSLLLERLVLKFSSMLNHIQIKAPKLRSFDFTGNIELICVKKAPLLVKLSLVCILFVEAGQPHLVKYFESFPALEHLNLNYLIVRFLAAGSSDIAAKISSPLHCLKHLCLTDICLDELAELSYVLCLIRSSPNLQDIQMQIYYVALDKLIDAVPGNVVNDIPASFSNVTLNHLRVIKLDNITGTKPQMELIRQVSDAGENANSAQQRTRIC